MLEVPEEKIIAVEDHAKSPLFDERERLALEYADCMTLSDRDVSDELFGRLKDVFDEDALIELTAAIAWENASSKFNRALRVSSQGLWKRNEGGG
jgi:alkylhydroperoxidase family enzyme